MLLSSDSLLDKTFPSINEEDVIRKKITDRDLEKYEVAQLKCNFEPCSRPSDLLEKLKEKRKCRHEKLLSQLAASLQEVNLKTEKNITMSSMELKAHCKHFDSKLQNILENIDKPEVTSYCTTVFLEIQNKANEFKCQQEKLVNELYEDLMKFENDRATENEKLLRLTCDEIRKVGYFLPYEVQSFVEHETLKMNQLSLNNRRCYEDLKLTLTLLTEQTFKSFMDKVFCIQEKWLQIRLQETFSNLQDKAEKKISKLVPEAYARLELKGQELMVQLSPDNLYSTCKAEQWSRNVEEVVAAIDSHGMNLIDIYKKTLNAVYHGFDAEVEEIKNELHFVETLNIEERVIKPIIFEAQTDHLKDIESLEMFWQETLTDIKSHLKDLTQFLLDAGKLWDRHLERICESKKLILRALEKADRNNGAFFQDVEIKLNLSLDSLRQEHDQAKLEKAYEAVVAMLSSLKTKYESIYLEDVSTVEDFYKMMNLEADVLAAELREFIYEIHPVDHRRSGMHYYPDNCRYLPEGKPIFKEIQMCVKQIQAVRTWKFGVWTALECLAGKAKESLEPRAESWVKRKIENLSEKMSMQMELLDKRIERIKVEMFEKRLEEIRTHKNEFERHKEKIKFCSTQMKDTLQAITAKETNKINIIKENLNDLETNAKFEDRPGVLRGNQLMVKRKKEELENEIKLTFERFRVDCEAKASDMRQSNIQFMKTIKFFHENGNYSTEEGKMFTTMLEAVDKEINNELKNILKDSAKEESDFIKKLTLLFTPPSLLITSLYEETLFSHEIKERLESFKIDIREIAKTVKVNFEYLKAQSDALRSLVENPNESSNEIDDKLWDFIIQLLSRNVSNLFYPVDYPENSAVEEEVSGESEKSDVPSVSRCCCAKKLSLHITISKTATFRTAERVESFTCKDFKPQLFKSENPPDNDNTFMAIVSNALWTEMDVLQRIGCNFYKKLLGRKIIREDLIPANYDAFAGEILAKFKYYNVQVEQFWLQIILEFLPVVESLKTTANKFIEKKLNEYETHALKALKDYEYNFKSCIECQNCDNVKALNALDNKLLPLHGYPSNVNLLNELEEEVVRKTAYQRIQRESSIKKFKCQIKCFSLHHIRELSEIKAIEVHYSRLRERLFVEDFGNRLLDTITEYCNRGGFCTDRTAIESVKFKDVELESQKLGSGEVPSEHRLNFDDLMNENLHGVQTYLNRLKQLVERERLPDVTPPECSPCTSESTTEDENSCRKYCETKVNILLAIMDFNEPVQKILNRLREYIRDMKAFASYQENYQEEALYKWLSVWKLNVKKIVKLYRVKYEEKPEVLEGPIQPQPSGFVVISNRTKLYILLHFYDSVSPKNQFINQSNDVVFTA